MLEMSQSRTESYLNNIIRLIPANIYWKDLNSVILGGNLSHAKDAGFSDPKEVIGKTEHDFVWRDQADEIIRNDQVIMNSGIGSQLEETARLVDGALHTFLTCKDPLRDKNNQVIGIIGVSTDITHFKQLQTDLLQAQTLAAEHAITKATAEEEMRKTIMVLVGNIVHDLRTPLTTIKTVTDLLETLSPYFLEMFEEAQSLGAKKLALLNQDNWNYLLNKTPITDIQNGITMINDFINTTLNELANAHKAISSELTQEDLTINSSHKIINKTLKTFPFSDLERSKITFKAMHDFDFMGNSILMMKLLFNLIKNALEQIALNAKGEIIISTQKSIDYNLIIIKDTAGGAPLETVAELFNAYFTTKKEGTGIGLAFCKKTMLNFGGDIECSSIYGESMEFILKFPA